MTAAEELLRLAECVNGKTSVTADEFREYGDGGLWHEEHGEVFSAFFAACEPEVIATLMRELIALRSKMTCACTFHENGKVASACLAHQLWLAESVAAFENRKGMSDGPL